MRTFIVLATVLGAVAIAPAGVATPPDSFAAPGLRVTPPILNFGSVAQGETRDRTFSVTNTGTEPASLGGFIGTLTGFPVFTWDTANFLDTCPLTGSGAPVFLQPGATCTMTVTAAPTNSTAPGTHDGQFVFGITPSELMVIVPMTVNVR